MDIKQFFSKKTRIGRAVRTTIQVALAIFTFLYGLLSLPGFGDLLVQNGVVAVGTLVVITGIVSYIYNALEDVWRWLRG